MDLRLIRRRLRQSLVGFASVVAAVAISTAADLDVEFLAETTIPGDLKVDKTLVGGLSGLAYDPGCGLYYALSDDRGNFGVPRFFTLRVMEHDAEVSVDVVGATILRDGHGSPFSRGGGFDPEAIALSAEGGLFLATEGVPHQNVPPMIGRFRLDGSLLGTYDLPDHYRAIGTGSRGVRNNHGFESIALSPDESLLFAAVENALLQDGPPADLNIGSPARILAIELSTGEAVGEFLYVIEPVPDPPIPQNAFRTNGISEILVIDNHRLLVLERSFSAGVGNRVRLFLAELDGADNILKIPVLDDPYAPKPRPVTKTLLADMHDLGIDPDNLEGMAFGPMLPDGRRQLVMVSDNNFQPSVQSNQVLVFALSGVQTPMTTLPRARIHQIQGGGHFSPLVGRCVYGVEGVVTSILGQRGGQAFWVQDPEADDDPATSNGLLVTTFDELSEVEVGDLVVLDGRVEERSWGFELPVTRLVTSNIEIVGRGLQLPEPVILGRGGRSIPRGEVASRRLEIFNPERFAADAFETLEGMRVQVEDAVVVGPTSRHGEIVVVPDGGRDSAPWTARGGLRRTHCNVHPQRVVIDDRLVKNPPDLAVGARLSEAVTGVLHYTFGSYKLLNTVPVQAVETSEDQGDRTQLQGDETHLTIATMNLENLWAGSDATKFEALAQIVAGELLNPDILAVQEVQDDTGPEDNGVVTAEQTLQRLVETIAKTGGVRYEWRLVDPTDKADGGQPGANIRTAFLFNPERVQFVDRGACGIDSSVEVLQGPRLNCSPGLLDPSNDAFSGAKSGGGGSRKPLAGEFFFNDRRLFVVNLHLASKGGDDPIFGRRQPRITGTERRRTSQATVVASFVDELMRADEKAAVVVLGDLNDFEKSKPLYVLETAGLEDLVLRLAGEQRYSYVYLGNSQVLDHILVSPSIADQAEIDAVHVNADFPAAHRASDHDPIVVKVELKP